MACPNCDSTNVKVQKYEPAETEEVPGIWLMAVVLLCHDCNWGFNCTGTMDKRPKKSKATPI